MIWKEIPSHPNYAVSEFGDIKRIKKGNGTQSGKLLKLFFSNSNYYFVCLYQNNKPNWEFIHSLVAEAFIGCRPKGHEVHHKDGKKINNYYKNLEYIPRNFHRQLAAIEGKAPYCLKLTPKNVIEIRNKKNIHTCKELSIIYKVKESTIWDILNKKTWKSLS
jgi:hypothetical protein